MKILKDNFNIWKDFGCLHSIGLYFILCYIFMALFGVAEMNKNTSLFSACIIIPLTLYGISKYNEYKANSKKQLRAEFIKEIKNKSSEKIFKELIERDASGWH